MSKENPPLPRHADGSTGGAGSSPEHLCSRNCWLRLACASASRFSEATGALNSRLQTVQIAITGSTPIQFTTLRFRFCVVTIVSQLSRTSTKICKPLLFAIAMINGFDDEFRLCSPGISKSRKGEAARCIGRPA